MPRLLNYLLVLCVWLSANTGLKAATPESETVTFILSPANKPPFWYQQGGKARGLIPELLYSIAREQNIHLEMLQVPRKRGIELVRDNPHILMGLAREWVPDPEHFQFSTPVAQTRDVLISHQKKPVKIELSPSELEGQLLGTHFGYHYPTLEPLFEFKRLIRSDSHSERALLERLRRRRIDVAVMTEAVARWYLNRYGWQDELYLGQVSVASAELRLMAHPSDRALIQKIDRALAQRRADGSLQALQRRFFSQAEETAEIASMAELEQIQATP